MDIAALQTFIAVAESGSFSDAAERIFLTQPAVSKRIAALEDELGARLFDRIGRSVTLTEAGRALLPRAKRILDEIKDSRRAISNLSQGVSGPLSLGTSHHIGLHRLPPVLRRYAECYPKVRLDLRFQDSEAACRDIEHGRLELGVVTLPLAPSDALETIPVWPDPLLLVAAPDHPLTLKTPLEPHYLADYPAILPATGTYTRQTLERRLAPFGVALREGISTNYLETIKMMVSVGLGWSILPQTMIDDDVAVLHSHSLRFERTLGIVYHRERTLSNAAMAMVRLLQED